MGTLTGYQVPRPVNPHDANGISTIYPKADRTAAKTAYVTWLANKKNPLYGGGAVPGLFDHTGLAYSDETGYYSTGAFVYRVTVSGGKYVINGLETPTLTFYRSNGGTTYFLDTGNASGHPLRFSTTPDGTHGGGVQYTSNTTYKVTFSSLNAKNSEPNILYYYCSSHSGMGGKIILS